MPNSRGAFRSAGEPAGHVAADRQLRPRRRRGAKVRIERDEALQTVKRHFLARGQVMQPLGSQVTMLFLQLAQLSDQAHDAVSSATRWTYPGFRTSLHDNGSTRNPRGNCLTPA